MIVASRHRLCFLYFLYFYPDDTASSDRKTPQKILVHFMGQVYDSEKIDVRFTTYSFRNIVHCTLWTSEQYRAPYIMHTLTSTKGERNIVFAVA